MMNDFDNIVRVFGDGACILILIMYLISSGFILYQNQPASTNLLIISTFGNGLLILIVKVIMRLSNL